MEVKLWGCHNRTTAPYYYGQYGWNPDGTRNMKRIATKGAYDCIYSKERPSDPRCKDCRHQQKVQS